MPLERDLYASITTSLKQRGLRVSEQITLRTGNLAEPQAIKTRTPDHVAWEWQGDDLKLWAVEAKAGASGEAVNEAYRQAREYQFGVPYVYVSAEANLGAFGLGYLKQQLGSRQLGYMRASRTGAARVQLEPEHSVELDPAIHAENVARVRLRHVFVEDVVGEPVWAEKDQRGLTWIVAPAADTGHWQVCGQVDKGTARTWLSLLAEGADVGRGFAQRADGEQVAALIQKLGGEPRVVVSERRHTGFQPLYRTTDLSWVPKDGVQRLAEVLRAARALGQQAQHSPHFEIRFNLWPHGVQLTETRAVAEFRDLALRLRAMRAELDRHSGVG